MENVIERWYEVLGSLFRLKNQKLVDIHCLKLAVLYCFWISTDRTKVKLNSILCYLSWFSYVMCFISADNEWIT